jgi:hypothetical protein
MLNLRMSSFKLDRTAFKAHTLKEASSHADVYKKLSWQERLKIAAYLNSIAFNYNIGTPPRLDRTKFSAKSISA